jgi:hypothetical protein
MDLCSDDWSKDEPKEVHDGVLRTFSRPAGKRQHPHFPLLENRDPSPLFPKERGPM